MSDLDLALIGQSLAEAREAVGDHTKKETRCGYCTGEDGHAHDEHCWKDVVYRRLMSRSQALALIGHAEALLRIAEAARDVLNFGPHMTCDQMHHRPGDEHTSFQPCPAVDRFRLAKDKLRAALGGKT